MISDEDVLKTVYFVPIIIGILGNGYLICNYAFHIIAQAKYKHIDLILMHLLFVNTMFLLFRGIPTVIESWDLKYNLNDVVCKMIIYLRRMYRGLSLCSTCLLSGYQIIAISSKWTVLKARGPRCIFPSCAFCWILNLLIDLIFPVYVIGSRNSTNSKGRNKLDYCIFDPCAKDTSKIQLWKSLYVTTFVAFVVMTSSYVVYVLYRHHQQLQHIHSTSLPPRASSEIRATKVIQMLVSIFFLFNTTCSILNTYIDYSQATGPWVLHMATIISISFQIVSPFVLISRAMRIPQIFSDIFQRRKYSSETSLSTISRQILKDY
ncbi:vomeronasal type-1 receptor 1-like [Sarcophilus harrisii]